MKFWNQLKNTLLIVLLPVVTYLILGPMEIYSGNNEEFDFAYSDFFWIFLGISLGVWIFGSIIIALLPAKLGEGVNMVIFCLGVASYIQNMFMNYELSTMDGSPMQWEKLTGLKVVNTVGWIAILAIVVLICTYVKKNKNLIMIAGSGFLCAIQLVAVLFLVLTDDGTNKGNLKISGAEQFHLASEKNIIVFVLDTFGNTQFEVVKEQYPEITAGLADFTYYDNADCGYYTTFPSMTHMLTGNHFDFEAGSSPEWLENAWNSDRNIRFWQTLDGAGYSTALYTDGIKATYGSADNLVGKFDNIQPMNTVVDQKQLIKLLSKTSVYRCAPYLLKPYFEVLTKQYEDVVYYADAEGSGEISVENLQVKFANAEFYDWLNAEGLSVDSEVNNSLKIMHMEGTHLPYTLDENGKENISTDLSRTVRGVFVILNEYMQQMKELGLYEDATIIITADHGGWAGDDPQPIYFVKRSGEQHEEMQTNHAPIAAEDFQATILDIVGEDNADYGTSIFDWSEEEQRVRTVYHIGYDKRYPDVKGSSYNIYYKYTYSTDKDELNNLIYNEKIEDVLPATPW